MSKWITFVLLDKLDSRRLTDTWRIESKDGGFYLGEIKWYSSWRKYCFFPFPTTIFEEDCLRDIAEFCESETRKRRA